MRKWSSTASSSATITTTQINPYTSAKILLQDGISALMHMKLAYQQLTSIGENSSMVEPTKILLQDGHDILKYKRFNQNVCSQSNQNKRQNNMSNATYFGSD